MSLTIWYGVHLDVDRLGMGGSTRMFKDILFILTEKAARMHGELIHSAIHRLLPDARLRIIWHLDQFEDTCKVDVLVAPQVPWLPEVVAKCPQLRWLHLLTAGAERIFESGLHKGSYWISKSAGVNSSGIAEYVSGAMLFFAKQFYMILLNP